MNLPILYTFRRCPYAIRARMALYYSNVNVIVREISLKNRPEDLYAISKKGTVPVLLLPNGSVIEESLEIMLWALNQSDEDNWMFFDKNIQLNIISINDTHFKKHLDNYKYNSNQQNNDELFELCAKYLDTYEKSLDKYLYILSNNISLVDISLFPFIRQFYGVDNDKFISKYPNLYRWLKSHTSSDLFMSVMKKFDLWDKNISKTELLLD